MGRSSILVLFILLLLQSLFCRSDDQLTHTKPLSPGNKLISKSGDFTLGFFSKTNSSNQSLYLGIWYNNIPERTVVWVANRDSPISAAPSPILAVTNTSDLVLTDSKGLTSWLSRSNISTSGATGVLLNTGNFVVRLPNGTDIWQSFDHPTNTLLPSMRFLVSTVAAGRLVAWKGPNDPSSGDFSYNVTFPDPQFVIWNKTRPYCRVTVMGSVSVSGATLLNNGSSVVYQQVVSTGNEFNYMFTISEGSPFTRAVLDYTGSVNTLSWNNRSSSWALIAAVPAATCEIYGSCGPFSYCDLTQTVPTCQCLDGFEPDGFNFSRGCRRTTMLECDKQSHFVTFPSMKVPDKFLHIRNRSFDQCATECSRNCSCTAYAYANLSSAGAMADPSRCFIWSGELIDITKNTYGENLYLRLASSSVDKKSSSIKIVLPIIACLLLLACISLFWRYKYRGKWRKRENMKKLMQGYLNTSNDLEEKHTEFPFVSYEDILSATNVFVDSNLLGRGGFGKVYKAMLKGGNEVAIKRLSVGSGQGMLEFKNEVVLIAKLQHKNLVRLLGYCIHEDEKLLIYEYLPNKSLDAFIFDVAKQHVLDWLTRFKIIKGIARGLLYLHQDSRLTIIHRDLKASNILLDQEMTPKISDFGMARIFGANQDQENTTRVVGTYGYMSPEYAMRGAFSVKSDTYSFGVLLLEIISGYKISSPQLLTNFFSLIAYTWGLWEDGKATELVDSSVVAGFSLHEVLRCIHVGLLCVQDHPSDRPLMSSVIYMLENESAVLPTPKEPLYFALNNREGGEERESMQNLNGMSITTLDGR